MGSVAPMLASCGSVTHKLVPGPQALGMPPLGGGAMVSLSRQPENILCVAAVGHMVKIIDFGLARR